MSVPQYTTPTFTLTFGDELLDLTEASNVYVTFRSRGCTITKSGQDLTVEEKTISVFLSQEETGMFLPGIVEIQANWTIGENRAASNIVATTISEQLLRRVVE